MESKLIENKVLIELTKEEIIVFFEWLSNFNEMENSNCFIDQAEERVLWDIEASIEKVLDETIQNNYEDILKKARKKLRDS